jgi:hypothetical protein
MKSLLVIGYLQYYPRLLLLLWRRRWLTAMLVLLLVLHQG